jgi:hypothetical protein
MSKMYVSRPKTYVLRSRTYVGPAKGGIFRLSYFCKIQYTEYSKYSVYIKIIASKLNFNFCETLLPTQILIEYMIAITEHRALVCILIWTDHFTSHQ